MKLVPFTRSRDAHTRRWPMPRCVSARRLIRQRAAARHHAHVDGRSNVDGMMPSCLVRREQDRAVGPHQRLLL